MAPSIEEFETHFAPTTRWAEGSRAPVKAWLGFAKLAEAPEQPEAQPDEGPAPWEDEQPEAQPEANGRSGNGFDHSAKAKNGFASFSSDDDVFHNYTKSTKGGAYVCEYIYCDPTGKPHQKAIRKQGKKGRDFPQEHWDGVKWVDGAPAITYPYRLPELIAAGPDAEIHLFEGEKDADNGAAWGLVATTNPCGAGQWTPALSQWLITLGFEKVVVHIDNDEAGRRRKAMIGAQLGGKIDDLRFIEYTELKEHGDFTNWQEAGGTLEQLHERIAATEKFGGCLDVIDAGEDRDMPSPRGWLLGYLFCRQFVSSLFGDGGVGKTATRYTHYLSVATKRDLVGLRPWVRGRVLLLFLEDGTEELCRRMLAARKYHGISLAEVKGWLFYQALGHDDGKLLEQDAKGRLNVGALTAKVEATIKRYKIDLVAFDPFVKAHAVTENDNNAIDAVVQVLANLSIKYDIAVDAPHHVSKGQAGPGDAQKGRGASAFVDGGRLIYTLSPMSSEEADQFGIENELRRYYVRMDKGKVNTTPPARYATWFKLVGVHLGNATADYPEGDNVQTVESWVPPEIWDDFPVELQNIVLDKIDAGLPNRQRYSNHAKAEDRAAWKVVVGHLPDKTKKQARDIIGAWLKSGVLEDRDYDDPERREEVKGLFVNPDKRPK